MAHTARHGQCDGAETPLRASPMKHTARQEVSVTLTVTCREPGCNSTWFSPRHESERTSPTPP
jgi:hypothetical protein